MPVAQLAHLTPDQNLIRHSVLTSLGVAAPLQSFVGWTVGGIAAVLGVILANLQNVTALVTPSSLKWGLMLTVASILLGVVAKQMLEAILFASSHLLQIYDELFSEEGIALLKACKSDPSSFAFELRKFYLWPMNLFIESSANKGGTDFLVSEKRIGKLFCIGLYFAWAHFLVGAAGLCIIALGIK